MNPLAKELNDIITKANPHIYDMLSEVGKNLFFPKGILTQSAEAKEKAHKFNATIGMAKEKGKTMYLSSVMDMLDSLEPDESITYAPSYGIMPLRKIWKESISEKNPSLKGKEISLPVVTNAITHGLSVVSDVWIDPGDRIILPDKMWGNYRMIFEVRRSAEIVQYPLFDGKGGFNLKGFRECLLAEAEKSNKVIVILNFPNNPTGYSVTPEEGASIADILTDVAVSGTNVVAVTDDAYFGLFYEDEVMKESVFSSLIGRDPKLLAIKLDGATKENYVWGLRVGFVTYGAHINGEPGPFYDALERKTAGDVRGSISNASHLSQTITLKSLQSDNFPSEKQEKFGIMKERAMEVKDVLADDRYDQVWEAYPFNSGYFMCLRLKTVGAEPLRAHLLDKYGVGLISIGKSDMRIAFSCIEKEDIRELFDVIYQGIQDLG
ncbi:aminotransferase class I/II-fold pyridoxal phosphate-dependent enzyme [Deltaproteobacteria bacterium]|nr:aminotransferase class I/II-fold pyridoxal phosphate-dependent enzyme [Deltaproteobacteria bacterium]